MPVKPIDTLLAIKAISLAPGLREIDRRVGVILIEHYNRKSGRCDPGLGRLADLLGCCSRTVIRATQRLEKAGLFRKARHGGYSHRNSYEPKWERFAELEVAWKQRFQARRSCGARDVSPSTGHSSHETSDGKVTQTSSGNLSKKHCSTGHPAGRTAAGACTQNTRRPSSSTIRASEAARYAAERRWTTALHRLFALQPVIYGEVIGKIDEVMSAAATEAEMRRGGAGIAYILDQLRLNELVQRVRSAFACKPNAGGSFQGNSSAGVSDRGDAPARQDFESLKRTKK